MGIIIFYLRSLGTCQIYNNNAVCHVSWKEDMLSPNWGTSFSKTAGSWPILKTKNDWGDKFYVF